MDIQTLLYNLREEVSCPVCSDLFKDPRQLPCLHSFCLHCLKHWHQWSGSQNTLRCPKCQGLSRMPASGDLKDLPTSFYLNGMIDVLAIKEYNTTQVTCGNCGKKSSESSYCFQCCMFYCEQCLIGHNIMRNNKYHRILAVKEFQEKDYEDVLKRPMFCPVQGHQKKELEYVCKKCDTAVCPTCVMLDHNGHTLKLIEEEAKVQKIEMTALIEEQREDLQEKIDLVSLLDEDYAKLVQQGKNLIRDVETFADNLIKKIKAKKQNIISAVKNETRKSLKSLAKKRSEIEEEIKTIELSLEKVENLLTRSTNAEVVQLRKSLEKILAEIEQRKHISRDLDCLSVLVFVENYKMLDTVNGEEIGFLENPNQAKGSDCAVQLQGGGGRYGGNGGYRQYQSSYRRHQSNQQQRPRYQQNYSRQHYNQQKQVNTQSYNQPQQQQQPYYKYYNQGYQAYRRHQSNQQQRPRYQQNYSRQHYNQQKQVNTQSYNQPQQQQQPYYKYYNQGYQAGYQRTGYAQQQQRGQSAQAQQPAAYQIDQYYDMGY